MAAPYTPGQVRYPTLPTDVANWLPVAGVDSVSSNTLTNAKVTGGYDAARAGIQNFTSETSLVTGATGRAVTVEFLLEERPQGAAH